MKHSELRGSDLHSPSTELVENNTGVTIAKMKAVVFTDIGIAFPQIRIASGTVDVVRGITQTEILDGQTGAITALGFLNNIDTSSWTAGTRIFADNFGDITATPVGLPIGVVLKQDGSFGVIYVENTGITKADLDNLTFPDSLSLELQFTPSNPNFYTEPSYDVGYNIIDVNIYDTAAKTLHIFNKHFTYTSGKLSKVEITRIYDGQKLVKDIVYDSNGYVLSTTRTYTT